MPPEFRLIGSREFRRTERLELVWQGWRGHNTSTFPARTRHPADTALCGDRQILLVAFMFDTAA